MHAKKGDWVRIHAELMEAGRRAPQVPEDTAQVPFELRNKGFLVDEKAEIGSEVAVETVTGRTVRGTLIEIEPFYTHSFGRCVPELLQIDRQLTIIMKEINR